MFDRFDINIYNYTMFSKNSEIESYRNIFLGNFQKPYIIYIKDALKYLIIIKININFNFYLNIKAKKYKSYQ